MDPWAWLVLGGLGVFHGINPAMGWLFAVALALHRQRRSLVGLAVVPIVLGHAAAVGLTVVLLALAGTMIHAPTLHVLAAALLIGWGTYHFVRGHRQRFRVGMTTGMAGLMVWSFLMATTHGAGLMLAPVVLEQVPHGHHAPVPGSLSVALAAIAVHTLAMAATTVAVAVLVYQWVGIVVLRHAWFNLDRLWAGALIAAGVLLLFI